MNDPIVTQGLTKRYRNRVALEGLDLNVEEGSVFALLGANGAGKTTALKLLMNLHSATVGEARVLGIDARRLQGRHFEKIGYVSENQDPPGWMTLKYLLDYLAPFYPTWDAARAAELVTGFQLPLDRRIRHFSRGMRMKVALTASLAYHPKLLVLDEPFSGLDTLTREELVRALLECGPETTIVVSSHDLADIESFASHVGYLEQGRLRFSEELESLAGRFREVEVTLDDPALPAPWPAHWLQPEASSALVRFVETHFDAERTSGEIRLLFRGVSHIEANPMPLRSILLALSRASRPMAA